MIHIRRYTTSDVYCGDQSWKKDPNSSLYVHIDAALHGENVCESCMREVYETVAAKYVAMSRDAYNHPPIPRLH